MLKWVRRIFVFLLLGAIVNVAVAWGCVLCAGDRPMDPTVIVRSGRPISMVILTKRFGMQSLHSDGRIRWPAYVLQSGPDGEWTKYAGDLPYEAWASEGPAILTRAGWPMLSIEGWELDPGAAIAPGGTMARMANARWGWGWDRSTLSPYRDPLLPLRPMPHGFAVDSILYAALTWMLAYGLATVRRGIRKRQQRCVHCGYPRGTSPVCTECGEALACGAAGA